MTHRFDFIVFGLYLACNIALGLSLAKILFERECRLHQVIGISSKAASSEI